MCWLSGSSRATADWSPRRARGSAASPHAYWAQPDRRARSRAPMTTDRCGLSRSCLGLRDALADLEEIRPGIVLQMLEAMPDVAEREVIGAQTLRKLVPRERSRD